MPKKQKQRKSRALQSVQKVEIIAQKSSDPLHRRDCRQMVEYFVRNGYLPVRLKSRIKELISLNSHLFPDPKRGRIWKDHYLYAISDQEAIKVGFSSNPEARLKTLQTSNSKALQIVWRCYAGEDDKEAKKQEEKLHRKLKRYRIRGEWYKMEALPIIKQWRSKADFIDKQLDEDLLALDVFRNI